MKRASAWTGTRRRQFTGTGYRASKATLGQCAILGFVCKTVLDATRTRWLEHTGINERRYRGTRGRSTIWDMRTNMVGLL